MGSGPLEQAAELSGTEAGLPSDGARRAEAAKGGFDLTVVSHFFPV